MKRGNTILILAALLSACAAPERSVDEALMDAWKAEIMAADRAFNQATARDGAAGWASFFAPNGSQIGKGVGEIRGQETIRQAMEGAFSDPSFTLTWDPLRAEVASCGDLGYTVGQYESVRMDETREEVRAQGLYVSIWRRQADGSWKVEMDLGNPTDGAAGQG